jgi:O-antigen/teichoic acid export membrane protein
MSIRDTWRSAARVVGAIRGIATSSSGSLVTANICVTAMGIVSGVVTSRALMPELRGDLAVLTVWPALIATVMDLGFAESAIVRVARDHRHASAALRAGAFLVLIASVLGGGIGYVLLPSLLREGQGHLLGSSRAYLLFVPASLFSSLALGTLLGLQRFRAVGAMRIAVAAVYLGSTVSLAASGMATPDRFAALTLLTTAAPVPLGLILMRGALRGGDRTSLGLRDQMTTGTRLQGMKLIERMAAIEDRPVAAFTLSQVGIGLYQIPSTLAVSGQTIALAKAQWLFSRLPGAPPEQKRSLIITAYARATSLTLLLALGSVPLLPFAIPLLYGSSFQAAVLPAIVVMLAAPIEAAGSVLRNAARSTLRIRELATAELGAIAVMAGAAFAFTPITPLVGLAAAYMLGRAFSLGWMISSAKRALGVEPRDLAPWSDAVTSAMKSDLAELRSRTRGALESAGG